MWYQSLPGISQTDNLKEGISLKDPESPYGMLSPEPFGTTALSIFRFDVENWLRNRQRKLHDMKRAKVR